MDVITVMQEVLIVANPVVRESALADFTAATNHASESVEVSAFDQLHGMFERHVAHQGEQQVDMLGHNHESMKLKFILAPVPIERFEEQTRVVLDYEQTPTLPDRKRYEVGSGRGDETSGLQRQTSAAKAAIFA